jgi:hypothetical protein
MELEVTFEKRRVRCEVVLGEWGTRDFYVERTSPPTVANIHLQAGTMRHNRKDS